MTLWCQIATTFKDGLGKVSQRKYSVKEIGIIDRKIRQIIINSQESINKENSPLIPP